MYDKRSETNAEILRSRISDDHSHSAISDFCGDKDYDAYTRRDPITLAERLSSSKSIYCVPAIFGPSAAEAAKIDFPVLEIDTIRFDDRSIKICCPAPLCAVICDEGELSLARMTHEEFIEFYNIKFYRMALMNAKLLKYAWQGIMSGYYDHMISKIRR
jgi:hypothetical protein